MKKTIKLFTAICAIFCSQQFSAQQTCLAEAGPNKSICCPGGNVIIGGALSQQTTSCPCDTTHNIYSWTPTTGLSNPNILNPTASPNATTLYKLCVTYKRGHSCGIVCCVACDSMIVTVNNICCRLMKQEASSGASQSNFDIKVFPNPANTDLNVEINSAIENGQIVITDLTGRVVYKKDDVKEKIKLNIDIATLPKGIYFLKINDSGLSVYENKFIIE